MARLPKKFKHLQALVLIVAAIVYFGIKNIPFPAVNHNADTVRSENYVVERVVDGDTLKLFNSERVRLIGVDTPEVHYSNKLLRDSKASGKDIKTIQSLGLKASDFTKNLCAGKRVRLEYDVEKRDRYGRLLAYVYLDDGTFVNAKIVEEGYGRIMTIPPNVKYADYFRGLEREARSDKRGLWKLY